MAVMAGERVRRSASAAWAGEIAWLELGAPVEVDDDGLGAPSPRLPRITQDPALALAQL